MLIYVDKKKEKQKKIKIISLILCGIFIVLLNIKYYYSSQNSNTQSLTSYQTLKHSNPWYNQSSPIYLFSSKQNPNQNILIIPSELTRENATTIAFILSKLPYSQYSLNLTTEVPNKKTIRNITEKVITISNTAPSNITITTDLSNVEDIINDENLYPSISNYKKAQKTLNNSPLNEILNDIFPLPIPVEDDIKKEQQNLKSFSKDNLKYLKRLILKQKEPPFTKQYLFLQNVRLCLKSKDKISCSTSTRNSLKKNLAIALQKLKKDTPHKLLLWTSDFPLDDQSFKELKSDEGIYFKSQNRESFLLPQDINTLTNQKDIIYILKQKVGLNPQYTTPDMKFYKFKITEVDLDDNI